MSLLRRFELEERGDSDQGALNGVTSVEIVPAPASGFTRRVESIRFVNKDTVAQLIRVRKTITGPTHYEFSNSGTIEANQTYEPVTPESPVRLTDTDQSVTALMDSAITTTNPSWVASWVDVPVPI